MIVDVIKDLTNRVQANLCIINGNLYLDVYLIDEFFRLVAANWRIIKDPEIAPHYLKLQQIILNDVLLNIIVGREIGNLYNSMMTYNANCTEEDLHKFYNIPYGGDGEVEHLCVHTGYGNGTADLNAGQELDFVVSDSTGRVDHIKAGPRFEVKDYKSMKSAKKYFWQDAETSVYHDATHAFIHILDTNEYYLAANKKTSNWFQLVDTDKMPHYRQQVKLWIANDGFLGVCFR